MRSVSTSSARPKGAGGLQLVGAGVQGDIGAADLRPAGGHLAVPVQRLPGKPAVGDVEAGVDGGASGQSATGVEAGVDVGARQTGKAGWVEVLQTAAGAEGAVTAEVHFALGLQTGAAGSELELRQAAVACFS